MAYDKLPLHVFDGLDDAAAQAGPTLADLGLSARAQSAELNALAEQAPAEEHDHDHAHDHGPDAPEPGAPAATTTEVDTAAIWSTIETLLNTSALGTTALERMTTYGVTVRYEAGGGNYYSSSANQMTLDTNRAPERLALSFVHEMNHAHWHHQDMQGNASEMEREAYVTSKLLEEVEGVVLSIEAKGEIIAGGTQIAMTYPLEEEYHAAYLAAQQAGQGAEQCLEAARARVMQGFRDGEVSTSNTGVSYPDYYGAYWDRVHAN